MNANVVEGNLLITTKVCITLFLVCYSSRIFWYAISGYPVTLHVIVVCDSVLTVQLVAIRVDEIASGSSNKILNLCTVLFWWICQNLWNFYSMNKWAYTISSYYICLYSPSEVNVLLYFVVKFLLLEFMYHVHYTHYNS